jgi:hypothetical protein
MKLNFLTGFIREKAMYYAVRTFFFTDKILLK